MAGKESCFSFEPRRDPLLSSDFRKKKEHLQTLVLVSATQCEQLGVQPSVTVSVSGISLGVSIAWGFLESPR